jgi:septal ring factor EnvC (AmiA/AmiB activator)
MPAPNAIGDAGGWGEPEGFMVAPGSYSVELAKRIDGEVTPLAGPVDFDVLPLRSGALEGAPVEEVAAFWTRLQEMQRQLSAANRTLDEARDKVEAMRTALTRSTAPAGELDQRLYALDQQLYEIQEQISGKPSMETLNESQHTISGRVFVALIGVGRSTYGPTPTHERSLEIAEQAFVDVRASLNEIVEQRIPALEQDLFEAGAPWTPGSPVPGGS